MDAVSGFNHVDWSYSTARVYDSCPRRFYFTNQPSVGIDNEGQAIGSRFLSPGATIGTVVHDCIEAQIDRWQKGDKLSLQAAQRQATGRLQAYVERHEKDLEESFTPDDEEFDSTDRARSLIRTAHKHIERFFQVIWPQFGNHQYILHEETKSITVGDTTVRVRPDLCTRTADGDFVITDWKATKSDPFEQPSLQLQTYALWAYKEYEPDPDSILVQLVHTSSGEFDRDRPTAGVFQTLKYRIQADHRDWSSRSKETDFETRPERSKCRTCPVLDQCSDGRAVTES